MSCVCISEFPNLGKQIAGASALHIASELDHADVAKVLLESGADVNNAVS